jgi:hypothetical protein
MMFRRQQAQILTLLALGSALVGCCTTRIREVAYHEAELDRIRSCFMEGHADQSGAAGRSAAVLAKGHLDALVSLGAYEETVFPLREDLVVEDDDGDHDFGEDIYALYAQVAKDHDDEFFAWSLWDGGMKGGPKAHVSIIGPPHIVSIFRQITEQINSR